jgi:membrane protein DedA with SNARE-associated domain/rhodanese-related sulfurtransferase
MNELLEFLLRNGYWLTLGAVFLEQMGLPLPAVAVLIGMGALARHDAVSFSAVIFLALAASLAADLIWYYLGRRYGRSVLQVICRISLEPDFCVRRTEDAFARRGIWALPLAKFVPGLNAAAVPLAGMIDTSLPKFLAFDSAGVLLWAGAYTTLGYVFNTQVEQVIEFLSQLGNSFGIVAGAVVGLYIGYKFLQRRRYRKMLATDRISPEELKAMLDARSKVFVVDLRNQLDMAIDRFRIPGAFHALPEIIGREDTIPHDGDVILYCTCPNEATSARVAIQLRRMGVLRVRPLAGGLGAWRDRGFPVEMLD